MHYFLLLLISVSSTILSASEKFEVQPLALGARAPDFKLKATDGSLYTLDSFKNAKVLVVVFTTNHCPDARASRQRINTFARNFKEKGVELVAINANSPDALQPWELGYAVYGDDFESMKAVAKEEKYVHPYLYDGTSQTVAKAYGALATPHTFVFDNNRKLIYQGRFDNGRRNPGPASENNVISIVTKHLEGKAIDPKKAVTRPFGCSTKWLWKKAIVAKKQAEWQALPVSIEALSLKQAKMLAANKTNKIRILNLWSTSCGSCVAEFPDLIDAYRRYQRRGVELITISLDPKNDSKKVLQFLKKEHLPLSPHGKKSVSAEGRTTNNYHFQEDDLDALANALDPKWQGPMPHTIMIAPGGDIIYRHSGQIDPVKYRRAIVDYLDRHQKLN